VAESENSLTDLLSTMQIVMSQAKRKETQQLIVIGIICITNFIFSTNLSMTIPILPIFLRDTGIYSCSNASISINVNQTSIRVYKNENILNGLLFSAISIGVLIILPITFYAVNR
jgi:hypothetical protein